jgi:hypothetical protein
MNAEEVHKHGEKVLNDFGKTLWSPEDIRFYKFYKETYEKLSEKYGLNEEEPEGNE